LSRIRNIGIIAHIDAGKTTTTERLLYFTGQIHKIGEVDEGAATTDFMEQERERGITIQSAAVIMFWDFDERDIELILLIHLVMLIYCRGWKVFKGTWWCSCCFDGRKGVEPQSETVWRQANKYHVPRICFLNKINLIGGDFDKSFETIKQRLSNKAVALTIPIGRESQLHWICWFTLQQGIFIW